MPKTIIRQLVVHTPEQTFAVLEEMRQNGLLIPEVKSQGVKGVSAPTPRGQVEQKKIDPCDFLGDVVHLEPCTCGSSSMVSIHACQHEDRKRRSGEPGLCVTSRVNLNKIRDKDVRASMQCCESCPLRCVTPNGSTVP